MKRAIIIHGWESNPNEHWYQEEKNILVAMGYEVSVPEMPNTVHPKKDEWVKLIADLAPDEDTVLVGHSLGTPAILRYLEQTDRKVGKVVSVAGFARDLGYDDTQNFVINPFDWDKIRKNASGFIVLGQIKDPYVPFQVSEDMARNLGVEVIEVSGDDHFDKMDLDLINREFI